MNDCDASLQLGADELPDVEYLRDLAERIFKIPASQGVDQYDYDRLHRLAKVVSYV